MSAILHGGPLPVALSGNAVKENGTGILARSASEWVFCSRAYSLAGASCLYYSGFGYVSYFTELLANTLH